MLKYEYTIHFNKKEVNNMDQLLKEIEAAKNTNNKLILIIGTPGSGK